MSNVVINVLDSWSRSPQSQRLAAALGHFVWQGAVLGALAAIAILALRRTRPQVRYAALLLIFAGMSASPVVTYLLNDVPIGAEDVNWSGPSASTQPVGDRVSNETIPAESVTDTLSESATEPRPETLASVAIPEVGSEPAAERTGSVSPTSRIAAIWQLPSISWTWLVTHSHWFVVGWGIGVCLLSLRLAAGVLGAERARRSANLPVPEEIERMLARLIARMGIRFPVRVMESALAEVPALVGWLRPVLLLPVGARLGLTPMQLESLLAHELAHVRRHDYLVNLCQTVIETLLFYHPAVWWVSRQIRLEREHCCDDVAVAVCGDRLAYARALTALEESRTAPPRWVVAAHGGSLALRIRRLLGSPEPQDPRKPALAAVATLMAGLLLATSHRPDAASASAPENPATTLVAEETDASEPREVSETDATPEKKSNPRKPWAVHGRVTDAEGRPMPGVIITASAGYGTLHKTGQGESDGSGKYSFEFGPGILFEDDSLALQAATITPHMPRFFEKNLSRQGDLLAGQRLPDGELDWGRYTKDDIVLPGVSRQIDFTMLASAKVSGRLIDAERKPLEGFGVSLQGGEMPPSSSVVATTKTDAKGRFSLNDIPTGYRWQFLIEPASRQHPWNAWGSGSFRFQPDDATHELILQHETGALAATRFEIQIAGPGIPWKEAIEKGEAQQRLDLSGASVNGKQSTLEVATARLVLHSTDKEELAAAEPGGTFQFRATAVSDKKGKVDAKSKTNLERTQADAEGRFTLTFDNPQAKGAAKRQTLDPNKNQVIFQVFVKNAEGKLVEKIFKQLPAQKAGPYHVNVQVKPELVAHSRVSLTFVTIQPDHDQWVKAFFHKGKGTSYKGMWISDGQPLSEIRVDEAKTGWIAEESEPKQPEQGAVPSEPDALAETSADVAAQPATGDAAQKPQSAAQLLKQVVEKNSFWLDPWPASLSYTVTGSKPEAGAKPDLTNRVQIAGARVRWDMDAEVDRPAERGRAKSPMNYTYVFTPDRTMCLRAPPDVDKAVLEKKRDTHALRQGMLFSTGFHLLAFHGVPEKCRYVEDAAGKENGVVVIECEFRNARGAFGLGMDHMQLGKVDWRIDKLHLHVRVQDATPLKEVHFDPRSGAPNGITIVFAPEYLKIGEQRAPSNVQFVQKPPEGTPRKGGFREWILEARFQNVEENWLLDRATNSQDGTVVRQLQVSDISTKPIPPKAFDPPPEATEEKKP